MRAAKRSYRTSAAAGARWPNDRISDSSGRSSFDRTRGTVLGREYAWEPGPALGTGVGGALFDVGRGVREDQGRELRGAVSDVGRDVLEDQGREVLVPSDHEVPLVEVMLGGNPPPGDQGERGRPAIDEGGRLLVLGPRLAPRP